MSPPALLRPPTSTLWPTSTTFKRICSSALIPCGNRARAALPASAQRSEYERYRTGIRPTRDRSAILRKKRPAGRMLRRFPNDGYHKFSTTKLGSPLPVSPSTLEHSVGRRALIGNCIRHSHCRLCIGNDGCCDVEGICARYRSPNQGGHGGDGL
jgi:hypothetical protein